MYPRSYAQYTLLERLATGGMSEVDLARRSIEDAGYVRFLVIKRIRANHVEDDAFVRMFKDEARITSELRHTNIAQVYDFGRVGDEYYLALEYVPGTDLRAVTKALKARRQRMPVRMALRITADVLAALHYAHTRTDAMGRPMEIVHRDVNPRNVMISIAGEVKLIDFGVARATDRLERTQTDHFKGKIAYMAPEQVQGRDLDHRVDVFAMGLTLYEILSGRGAFTGLDQTQILYRILQGDLPTLEVPRTWGSPGKALETLVARALAHDRDARFADAEAMRRAVVEVAESFGGMPTVAELGAWVAELDPSLEPRVRRKMESWSGPLPDAIAEQPGTVENALDTSGSLAAEVPLTPGPTTAGTLNAPVMVAGGLGLGAAVLIMLVLGFGVGAAGLAVWWVAGGGEPAAVAATGGSEADGAVVPGETAEGSGQTTGEAGPSEPLRIGTIRSEGGADAVGTSGTGRKGAGDAGPGAPGTSGRGTADAPPADKAGAPMEPSAALAPDDEEAKDGVADDSATDDGADREGSDDAVGDTGAGTAIPASADPPTETVAPVVATTEPPPPAPEPAGTSRPEPVRKGTLQVAAARKGLPIFVDGKDTGHRTGEGEFEWPAGRVTVSVDGFQPKTVVLQPNMVKTVMLLQ